MRCANRSLPADAHHWRAF